MTPPVVHGEPTRANPPPSSATSAASFEPSNDNSTDSQPDVSAPGIRVSDEPDNLYKFPVKSKRGRPRKSGDDYRVSVEQVSKHTYAVRIRWKRADGSEDGVVVNRMRADIVKEIQRSKKRYEQFKAQTIASWKSRAVRQSDGARTDTVGNV